MSELVNRAKRLAAMDKPSEEWLDAEDERSYHSAVAHRIEALERACRAWQANPYDEAEYLDAMEAAMGVPPEPGEQKRETIRYTRPGGGSEF